MDRASAGLSSESTPADLENAVRQVYDSHLVKATVFSLYQTEAATESEKQTVVSDLEMMIKTTCELGTHWERLNERREPVEIMRQLEAYHHGAVFPSMQRKV
jgi:hypothetical protein